MALWVSGAVLAFLVTASAFLLLASFATVPSERSLAPEPPSTGSGLDLRLDQRQLVSLSSGPGQILDLQVVNDGDEDLSDVTLSLSTSSENTALPESRFYQRKVENLPAGEAINVRFEADLSAPEGTASTSSVAPEPSRNVLEVRASTPEGITEIRTIILPP